MGFMNRIVLGFILLFSLLPNLTIAQDNLAFEGEGQEGNCINDTLQTGEVTMALKTNMLYDIALIPNIGAEIHIGNRWSVAANWHYAWWDKAEDNWFWRTYGGEVALRKFFSRHSKQHPLAGHHIGVYGQMITYDFETGNDGILAEPWSWAVGLEYGYSLPIGRKLNIDFVIGAGYHWGIYDEYTPIDGHYVWQATKERNYFGPTKAEVSLVYLIGKKNYNKDKGGRR